MDLLKPARKQHTDYTSSDGQRNYLLLCLLQCFRDSDKRITCWPPSQKNKLCKTFCFCESVST